MKTKEVWKAVKGYEGIYEVSSLGRVKSLSRNVWNGFGYYKLKERILKHGFSKGYPFVILCKESKQSKKIHQLVAIAFLNHKTDGYSRVINHIDGVKTNNKLSNLEVVTQRENASTCFRKDRGKMTSKFIGVSYYKPSQKWVSHITINGKLKNLGYSDCEIEASKKYQTALTNHLKNAER